jgi:hypothetical protein
LVFDKLTQALSLLFGIEAIVVLKDIWELDGTEAQRVATWAANALVHAAIAEASAPARTGAIEDRLRHAASRPRKNKGD